MKVLGKFFALFALASPVFACNVTVSSGGNVPAAVSAAATWSTICLSNGSYNISTSISLKVGQRLTSVSGSASSVTIVAQPGMVNAVVLADDATVDNISFNGMNMYGIDPQGNMIIYNFRHAVYGYGTDRVTAENLVIDGFWLGIAIDQSTDVSILSNYISENGMLYQWQYNAEPSIWVNGSSNVTIYGNTSYHASAFGPSGDGEIACHGSSNVDIVNNDVINSGAGAIYLVDCDGALVDQNYVYGAKEFGIDVVGGSQSVMISSNLVENSRNAGAIFLENQNGTGTFQYNHFVNNNLGGGYCNGMRIVGNAGNMTFIGNTNSGGTLQC